MWSIYSVFKNMLLTYKCLYLPPDGAIVFITPLVQCHLQIYQNLQMKRQQGRCTCYKNPKKVKSLKKLIRLWIKKTSATCNGGKFLLCISLVEGFCAWNFASDCSTNVNHRNTRLLQTTQDVIARSNTSVQWIGRRLQ